MFQSGKVCVPYIMVEWFQVGSYTYDMSWVLVSVWSLAVLTDVFLWFSSFLPDKLQNMSSNFVSTVQSGVLKASLSEPKIYKT